MNKEFLVMEYMKNVDMKNENLSFREIKEGLKKILHEEPAISINYENIEVLNEIMKTSETKERMASIDIFFTEIGIGDNETPKKITFLL
jgi:hypothetical protein